MPLVEEKLSRGPGRLDSIAVAMSFLRRQDPASPDLLFLFGTIVVEDPLSSVLLASGNINPQDMKGKLLFQPWVVRPKLFSPPYVLTANSMVLDNQPVSRKRFSWISSCFTGDALVDKPANDVLTYNCIGCVRGLGMVYLSENDADVQVRVV